MPRANYAVDAPLTAGALVGWWALYERHPDWVRLRCPCEPQQVNKVERFAIHKRWGKAESLANGVALLVAAAPAGLLALVSPDPRAWLSDASLVAESTAITGLTTQGVKTLVGRPYPYMFGPAPFDEQNHGGVNYASFWSGHTAIPMAAAVSFSYLVARRKPHSPWRWVAWVVGPALALTAGALQVLAANHFPSDVLAGGIAGGLTSYANLALHEP